MPVPTVPFYGKDSERLAKLTIAYKALLDSGSFLDNWPLTVANHEVLKEEMDGYQVAYEKAIHGDRRAIAERVAAGERVHITWQKIVNYACSTQHDQTTLLERMGVLSKSRRGSAAPRELYAPDLSVVNLDQRSYVRASCSRERRRYTFEVQVTEGDPRLDEGWYHKGSFADCTRMDMNGFQSGKEISFRCRIIGKDNSMGPWSHIVTLMVT